MLWTSGIQYYKHFPKHKRQYFAASRIDVNGENKIKPPQVIFEAKYEAGAVPNDLPAIIISVF